MKKDGVIKTMSVAPFVPCMLIPLKQHYLLLPNKTIAEVIPIPTSLRPLVLAQEKLAYYEWQQKQIAILDLENLVEQSAIDNSDANKLCIIHSINPGNNIDAFAIPCQGAPQLIHLNETALKLVHPQHQSNYIHCQIDIASKIAYIPNLDELEAKIVNLQSIR